MAGTRWNTGDEYTVTARAMSGEGAGVCDAGGFVVFVAGLLPGERARVRLTDVRKSYARAALLELYEASGDRTTPACAYFGDCGGCVYMHMRYDAELAHKRQVVADAFRRIAGMAGADVRPVIGAWDAGHTDCVLRYRNKGQYAYTGGGFGFYETGSRDTVTISDCLLQKDINREILQVISYWLETKPAASDGLNGAVIRVGEYTGDVVVILNYSAPAHYKYLRNVLGTAGLAGVLAGRFAGVKSVVLNIRDNPAGGRRARRPPKTMYTAVLYGDGYLHEKLGRYQFRISHDAFFQVNTVMAKRLYDVALEFARAGPNDFALDLFCGAGAISAYLAESAGTVVGVEMSGGAVRDARTNAAANGIDNMAFVEGRAEHIAASFVSEYATMAGRTRDGDSAAPSAAPLANERARPDIVTLDPPRGGCGAALLDTIKKIRPRRVVYVSCEPATLCRDAARLCSGDGAYAVAAIQPVDMFPRTASVETAVLFVPVSANAVKR